MRKIFLILLFSSSAFAEPVIPNTPFPVFFKLGFSSVLEFSEAPQKVVVGDSQSFQVEKMESSLVVRAVVPYATSNMFVYFKSAEPKLFTLTASEDANPTLYHKFEMTTPKAPVVSSSVRKNQKTGTKLISAQFDKKKDYLTVDFFITADSLGVLQPKWNLIRLSKGSSKITPYKVWSERREVQKDSAVKGRLIFLRPSVGANLSDCYIVIPLKGRSDVLHINLAKGKSK